MKDFTLSVKGSMAALSHAAAADEILKNSMANFAFENLEIAAYKSLITIAELGGYEGLIQPLQTNLDEELAMASWLQDNLRATTIKFAKLKESGQSAEV